VPAPSCWPDLVHDVLGTASADLFPAWALSQRHALEAAGISPPTVDLTVALPPGWQTQPDHLHPCE